MASPLSKPIVFFFFFFFLFVSLFVHAALGEIVCERLPKELCTLSIASSGKRCLLENYSTKHGTEEYECKTSDFMVEKMADYIESDECVKSCGIDRSSVGISSDSLLDPQTTAKICSPPCYHNCPNVVDLYFNLAAGEGVFLPDICEAHRTSPHRAMSQLLSSGVHHHHHHHHHHHNMHFASGPGPAPSSFDAYPPFASFHTSAPAPHFNHHFPSFHAGAPAQNFNHPFASFHAHAPAPNFS